MLHGRPVVDVVGDVILTVANTSPRGYFICAGESGIIYFIDPMHHSSENNSQGNHHNSTHSAVLFE